MTKQSERTDVHRPSAIIPSDYEYVAIESMKIEGFGDVPVVLENRAIIAAHMARTGGFYSMHEHGGNCHICGAGCTYTVLFYHAKSNVYIRTGNDCAAKLDMAFDENAFKRYKTALRDAREAKAGKTKAQALLADKGVPGAWEAYLLVNQMNDVIYRQEATEAELDATNARIYETIRIPYEESTIADIVRKVVLYGSLSDKAASFLGVLLAKIPNRAAIREQHEAQAALAANCPAGRVRIKGVVLGLKTIEREARFYGDSGIHTNILVQADEGFKVYGSRFDNVEKGDRVDFTATITVSDNDKKFGFFKRPRPGIPVKMATAAQMKTIAWG